MDTFSFIHLGLSMWMNLIVNMILIIQNIKFHYVDLKVIAFIFVNDFLDMETIDEIYIFHHKNKFSYIYHQFLNNVSNSYLTSFTEI